jgi:outer membrane protein TolC
VFEAAIRQPLLQGAGIAFNRIAGPDARPGSYNGVLIGRINTDVSLADFEAAVRDLLLEVERTYWELYFSYRNLDAKRAALEAALQTWRAVESRRQAGLPGADSEREALAREQYYAALAEVENALSGTFAGGLVVATTTGLYNTERRLRYLMGVPVNDDELLRPADEPITVDVAFDWNDSLLQALTRRVELRRQKFIIRRRELELLAARNFLRMRLDTVAAYRWRGFGDDLFGSNDQVNGSAFEDLFSGNLQEWQLGLELSTPIGNRIGHTAVRNAEWNLTREVALLEEQEREITRGLSRAFSDLDWAYNVSRANYNRTLAASQQLEAVQAKYEAGLTLLEFVIDAQRRAAEAASTYYRSLVDHSVAVANVHLARGTLLDYQNVYLTESPWSGDAYASAQKQARRFRRKSINYCCTTPRPVSAGAFPQQTLLPAEVSERPEPESLPAPP